MAAMRIEVKEEVLDASHMSRIEEEIFKIVQSTNDGGIDLNSLGTLTPSLTATDRADAINRMLTGSCGDKRLVLVSFPDGSARLKVNNATELSGASEEEQTVYNIIEESNTKGIWIRDLRDMSGLSQIQLRKILKALEGKKLIKTVKAVGDAKKCYMLFNLQPDVSLTGGTFYSDQQLDAELIHTLVNVCTGFIQSRRKHALDTHPDDLIVQKETSYIHSKEVADFIVEKKILNVSISLDDIERIIDVAILDGTVERRNDGKVRACSSGTGPSPLVSIPCSTCPVIEDCKPGCVISPETCKYMTDWLSGK